MIAKVLVLNKIIKQRVNRILLGLSLPNYSSNDNIDNDDDDDDEP